jgi:hypothetical protein
MNLKIAILLSLLLAIAGCATTPLPMQLTPGAGNIIIAKSDPGDNYEIIGAVSGFDGKAPTFGFKGYFGTYERATISLLNRTYEMGGNYAQILSISEPFLRSDGSGNYGYYIRATAFKKVQNKQPTTPAVEAGEERLTKKLRELKKLLDDGVLSKNEYENQKAKLLEKGF